jgi:hypothetical protein
LLGGFVKAVFAVHSCYHPDPPLFGRAALKRQKGNAPLDFIH